MRPQTNDGIKEHEKTGNDTYRSPFPPYRRDRIRRYSSAQEKHRAPTPDQQLIPCSNLG
jgi:hypothetical protein